MTKFSIRSVVFDAKGITESTYSGRSTVTGGSILSEYFNRCMSTGEGSETTFLSVYVLSLEFTKDKRIILNGFINRGWVFRNSLSHRNLCFYECYRFLIGRPVPFTRGGELVAEIHSSPLGDLSHSVDTTFVV